MNKIAQKMLHHKKGIVALFAVLAVLCALLSRRVKVDYNMMHYLPKDAPSTIALDVMEEEYSQNCQLPHYDRGCGDSGGAGAEETAPAGAGRVGGDVAG